MTPRISTLFVLAASLAACIASKQYVLKIDADDPGRARLCDGTGAKGAESCEEFTNDALEAPATLAVVVEHPKSGTYHLRQQQTLVGGPQRDPGAILAEALRRFEAVGGAYLDTKMRPPGAAPDPADAKTIQAGLETAAKQFVAAGKDQLAAVARAEAEKLAGPLPPPPRIKPSALSYALYFAKDTPPGAPIRPALDDAPFVLLGQSIEPYPPPRIAELDAEHVAYLGALDMVDAETGAPLLDKKNQPVRNPELGKRPELAAAALVRDYCSVASFGNEPYDGRDTPLVDYFAAARPTPAQLAGLLGLDTASLEDLLNLRDKARGSVLLKRLKELRGRGDATVKANRENQTHTPLEPGEQLVVALYDAERAHADVATCLHNVDFVAKLAADKPADKELAAIAAALGAERPKLVRLREVTTPWHEVFYSVVDSLARRIVLVFADGTPQGDRVAFGSRSIQNGELRLTVTRTAPESGGGQTEEVADYRVDVESNPRFAISVGPAIFFCRDCFRRVSEQVTPSPDGSDMDARRELVLTTRNYSYASLILLHVTLVSRSWFAGGVVIGYPVADTAEMHKAGVIGISVRHRWGATLSAGIDLFEGAQLKPAYGGGTAPSGTVIDTTKPGLVGLTAESVVDAHATAAIFINLGVTSDLFQRLD